MISRNHEIEVSITIGDDPPVKLPGVDLGDGHRIVQTSHARIVTSQFEPDRVDLYRNGGVARVYGCDHSVGRIIATESFLGPGIGHLCYYLGLGGSLILSNRTDVFVEITRG